ncbi:MAG: ankyrin repeat domain-containing protein [Armatimonadota bacterium]
MELKKQEFWVSVSNGCVEEVIRLLSVTPSLVIITDKLNTTPLHVAAANGNTEIVKALIGKLANVNACRVDGIRPIHSASLFGHFEIVQILLDSGADVNVGDVDGMTPLHGVAVVGNIEMAKLLIQYGADTHARTFRSGDTPYQIALDEGYTEVAQLIAQHETIIGKSS